MGIYYNPPNPHVGNQQPLQERTLTPGSGPTADNPPFMGGSRIGQSVLNCWAFAVAVAAIMPVVAVNLNPPQDGSLRFVVTGSAVPQAVLNSWLPPQPAPIVARNLNPPISGPPPQSPPLIGMRIPLAVQVAWIPPPPAPIVARNLTPPSVSYPPLIGMRIPAAALVAWIPPPPAAIVANNVNPQLIHNAVRTGTRPNEPVYLLEMQAYNPNTALLETKRLSTVTITTRPDDNPVSTVYDGRMVNAGELKRAMFENGATIGKPTTNVGYFELNNADGALDSWLDYGIGGWSFTLKLLADKDAYVNTATTVFIGTMRGFASSDLRKTIQVRIRDKMETLNQPLLTTRYAGTTNGSAATVEGDSTMAGKLKPYSIGITYQCPTEPANSFDLIYQGSITPQSTLLVYDGGQLLTQDADYASIALLRAATIAAGHYATARTIGGFIRLGALPAKSVTMLMGSSATEANLSAGAVAQQILLDGGVLIGDIDTASFAALTSGSGNWEVGLFVNDETTVVDAACKILNCVAATLVSTAAGKFKAVSIGAFPDSAFFDPIFVDETAVDTYTNDDLSDNSQFVLQASPQAEGDGVPAYEVNIKHRRKWQTLSSGDLVTGLSPAVIADAAKEYRETAQANLSIKTAQPLAQLLNIETLHSSSSGAIILGLRLLDFYSNRRDYLTFDLPATRAGSVDLGDIVIVKPTDGSGNPRYGYGADGKKMCIIGRHDQFGAGKVTLTAWG